MRHHFITTLTDCIDDFETFVSIGNFKLLLQEDRGLLI